MHRLLTLALLALLALLAVPADAGAATATATTASAARVIVGFEPGADAADRADARASADAVLVRTLGDPREQLVGVKGDAASAVAALEALPGVAYAEPDRVVRGLWAPGDPFLSEQWALGLSEAGPAWDVARGATALVGVADTGADLAHADLRFDPNAGEVAGNGLDDDLNGRVDDVFGYDFINGDGDPSDDNGHGTGVTGVLVATAGNGIGVAGVAPEASVIEAKVLGASGSGMTSGVADGMRYLAARGARVVNLSLGGAQRSEVIAAVLADYPQTLFVVAAGNSGVDNDGAAPSYPCADPSPNVVCAGASTRGDARASFSNWGSGSVDLMAPGVALLTTQPGGYATVSGTSFSAPMVAGAAALVFGRHPQASAADVSATLLATVDPVPAFDGVTVSGGRLNLARAVGATVPSTPAEAPAPAAPAAAPAAARPAPAAAKPKPSKASKRKAKASSCATVSRRGSPRVRKLRRARCLAARRAAAKRLAAKRLAAKRLAAKRRAQRARA